MFIGSLISAIVIAATGFNSAQAGQVSTQYYPNDFLFQIQKHQLRDQELKDSLFKILSSGHVRGIGPTDTLVVNCQSSSPKEKCIEHRSLGYDGARKVMFSQIYLENNGGQYSVTDVYCEKRYTDADFGGVPSIGPSVLPDGKVINTEHTWPQSRFTGRFSKDMQKSDLHHLYPTDSRMNSSRSSLHFGNVDQEVEGLNCNTAKLGHENGDQQIVFEPPPRHKGNVARSIFYFAVRYQMKVSPSEEKALRQWNREDPVDEAEVLKNEHIEKVQGNRNPFVDFPELIDDIATF